MLTQGVSKTGEMSRVDSGLLVRGNMLSIVYVSTFVGGGVDK